MVKMPMQAHLKTNICMRKDGMVVSCEKGLRRQRFPRKSWALTMKADCRRQFHYFGQDSVVGPYSLAGGKGKCKGAGRRAQRHSFRIHETLTVKSCAVITVEAINTLLPVAQSAKAAEKAKVQVNSTARMCPRFPRVTPAYGKALLNVRISKNLEHQLFKTLLKMQHGCRESCRRVSRSGRAQARDKREKEEY